MKNLKKENKIVIFKELVKEMDIQETNDENKIVKYQELVTKWDIQKANDDLKIKPQYSGKIDFPDNPQKRKDRSFVTKAFTITGCGILIFNILWGATMSDWQPLEKSSDVISFIMGYLLCHYLG